MFWYLLNILTIVLAWLWPINNINSKKNTEKKQYIYQSIRKKRVCVIATINWIILSGLRNLSIGADTLAYKVYRFDKTINIPWNNIFYNFCLKYIKNAPIKDPGYPLIEKVFQIFSTNYQMFLIFIAIIFFIPLSILIYKYSMRPCFSYIIFSTLFYSFFAITGQRQTIATAIVVFGGIELIIRRKLISFLLLVALSSTIHGSAICFLPFYWISMIKINKISLSIYWILITFSFIFKNQFLGFLQKIVGYEDYVFYETARGGTFLLLLLLLSIFITIFYKIILEKCKLTKIKIISEVSINALFIASIFSSLLLINQSFMRVIQYYSIFIMFLLPQCRYIFSKEYRLFFEVVCCTLMIILLIKNQPSYIFFWQ